MDRSDSLNISLFDADRRDNAFLMPWPVPGNPGAILPFCHFDEWQTFLEARRLHPAIPEIVESKFRRAQKLYLLAWIDFGLVKAGELVALTALELALKDRYGGFFTQQDMRNPNKQNHSDRAPSLAQLLEHMVEKDGLTDESLAFTKLCGGSVVSLLYESKAARNLARKNGMPKAITLAGIRNSLAHGDPFDGLPWSGLLELIRDLIEYAYRSYLLELEHAQRADGN
ncbi:hypothetical protein DM39_2041 [Burkholderia cenocepacia]|uniref:Uncharacterized protein n=1 Tax=Burkholderia cenocepacia TaxID=95486 RepID=A0AAN0VMW1_9BURK|nr:hypothetical protein DM39_2041 [Burkholderia cenocepacia]